MRIVMKETVHFSPNEMNAFAEVIRILEGVKRTASSPNLKVNCEVSLDAVKGFLADNSDFEEIEEDYNDSLNDLF